MPENETVSTGKNTSYFRTILISFIIVCLFAGSIIAYYFLTGDKGDKGIIKENNVEQGTRENESTIEQGISENKNNNEETEEVGTEEIEDVEEITDNEEYNGIVIDENLKLTQFILSTEKLYCAQKLALQSFADISNDNRIKDLREDSINIEEKRKIGKDILKQMEREHILEFKEDYMKVYKDDTTGFKRVVQEIGTTFDYFTKFLEADAKVKNFSEYQNIMLSNYTMATKTLKGIPELLRSHYNDFLGMNEISMYSYAKQSDVEISKNVIDIDGLCNANTKKQK